MKAPASIVWRILVAALRTEIKEQITNATPRLFKKFNYRIDWFADRAQGPAMLSLDNYAHGPTAAYNSWCLLEKFDDTA